AEMADEPGAVPGAAPEPPPAGAAAAFPVLDGDLHPGTAELGDPGGDLGGTVHAAGLQAEGAQQRAAYHLEDRVEVAVPGAVREVADRAAGRRAPAVRETVGLLDAGAREGVGLAGPYPVEEGVQVRDGELPVGVEQDDPVHPGVRDGGGDGGAGAAVLGEVDDDQFGADRKSVV